MKVIGVQSLPWLCCSPEVPCRDPIEDKIYSLAKLAEGWDYGEGAAPGQAVIDKAVTIYRIGKQLGMDAQVFPLPGGEIEVSLSVKDHFMDIVVESGEALEFSYEIGIGEKYRKEASDEDISLDEVTRRLRELVKTCGLSESLESPRVRYLGG